VCNTGQQITASQHSVLHSSAAGETIPKHLHVSGVSTLMLTESLVFHLFLFLPQVITPFRKLMLCAESRKEMEDWIVALKSVQKWETYEVSVPPPSPPSLPPNCTLLFI